MNIQKLYRERWLNRKGRLFDEYSCTFYCKNGRLKKLPIPKFDYVNKFYEGRCLVRVGDKVNDVSGEYVMGVYGYLNTNLEYAIMPQFFSAHDFSEGLACVRVNDTWGELSGKCGFINRQGKFIIKPTFDTADSFQNGVAVVSKNHKYWYIKKNGKALFGYGRGKLRFHETFDYAESFSEGMAFVRIKGDTHIISKNGRRRFAIKDHSAHEPYKNGLAFICSYSNGEDKWGACDKRGRIIIPFEYDRISGFVNGFAIVYRNDRVAFIDKRGVILSRYSYSHNLPQVPWYFEAKEFSENIAAVKVITDKWGFVNNKGRIIIDFIFDEVDSFHNGMCVVKKDGKWGVVNKKGNWVIKNTFDSEILNLEYGLEVMVGDEWYSLSRKGVLGEIDS